MFGRRVGEFSGVVVQCGCAVGGVKYLQRQPAFTVQIEMPERGLAIHA